MTAKAKATRYDLSEQRKKIFDVLSDILATETPDNVYADPQLVEMIQAKGVYCSPNMLWDVRKEYEVPALGKRKIALFEKAARKGK